MLLLLDYTFTHVLTVSNKIDACHHHRILLEFFAEQEEEQRATDRIIYIRKLWFLLFNNCYLSEKYYSLNWSHTALHLYLHYY